MRNGERIMSNIVIYIIVVVVVLATAIGIYNEWSDK